MTEAEWHAEANWLLLHQRVRRRKGYARKVRLFTAACCRRVAHLFGDPRCDGAVSAAEQFADGLATGRQLAEAASAAHAAVTPGLPPDRGWARGAAWRAARLGDCWEGAVACEGAAAAAAGLAHSPEEVRAQTVLFRDVFGSPFRPVAFKKAWRTSTAVALASQMYDSRDFSAMPILADALQEAGCASDDILQHARGPGPHVRGCWVVDLVLGKE
jgi:hypothetical protein